MKKRILSLLPVPIAGCAGGFLCSLLAALTVRGLPRILSFVGGILAPGDEIVRTLVRVFSPEKRSGDTGGSRSCSARSPFSSRSFCSSSDSSPRSG